MSYNSIVGIRGATGVWSHSSSGEQVFVGGSCNAVAYNGTNLWVAGGVSDVSGSIGNNMSGNSKIAYSSDGVGWTASTSIDVSGVGPYFTVAYGNGLWVAGGYYGNANQIAYSSDGVSWTGSASGDAAFAGGGCYTVAYNGTNLWVAGGDGNHKIAYSSDGVSWTGSTSGDAAFAGKTCSTVAYNTSSQLWTVGGGSVDFGSQYSSNYIATSSDGISWTGSASGNSLFNGLVGGCLALATNNLSGNTERWIVGGATITVPEPTPPPVVYSYVPSSSSFNTFPTNYRGMGNLGEYD